MADEPSNNRTNKKIVVRTMFEQRREVRSENVGGP